MLQNYKKFDQIIIGLCKNYIKIDYNFQNYNILRQKFANWAENKLKFSKYCKIP